MTGAAIHSNGAVSFDPNKDNNASSSNANGASLSRRNTASKLKDKMRLRKTTYETPIPLPAPSLPPTLSLSFDAPPPNSNSKSSQDQQGSASQAPPSPSRSSSLPLAPSSSPPPISSANAKSKSKVASKTKSAEPPSAKGMTPAEMVALQAMQPPTSAVNDKGKNRKDAASSTPQEKLEAIRNAKLDVDMINKVIEFCGSEIRMRGLATIGIFRPFRFSESQAKQTSLIQLLLLTLDPAKYDSIFSLDEACDRTSTTPRSLTAIQRQNGAVPSSQASSSLSTLFTAPDSPSKELATALNKANIHDVVALLRWSLRHTKLSFKDFGSSSRAPFDWYEQFCLQEKSHNYPTDALSLLLFANLPPSTATYLQSILSLLTTIGSHHSSNAMPCPRLCGMLGYWILRIGKESHWNLDDTAKDWERSKNVLSHLMLAFIREMEGEKGVISIPTRLKELVEGYPYIPSARSQSSHDSQLVASNRSNGFEPDSDGKVGSTAPIQGPTFPLAFSPPPQKALRVNLKSQNLIISSKRPRAPSESLRAAFGVEITNEQNSSAASTSKAEDNVWKFIVEEGRRAEESSKAPRKREGSAIAVSSGSNGGSISSSPIHPQTPLTPASESDKPIYFPSSPVIASGNPTPAQEEERERIRDEAREKVVVLEDHARILKLVAKNLKERRKLAEEQEKATKEKVDNPQSGGNGIDSTSTSINTRGLESPYSSFRGSDKMISGSPEFDMTPGSESTLLSSPGSRPSPFSRSVTEFGNFSSPSTFSSSTSQPNQSPTLGRDNMRRTASHNGSVIAPDLEPLPEDSDTKYTWLNGFSNDENPVDLSFSTVTIPASSRLSSNINGPTSSAGDSSQRPRRQSSLGSLKRKSLRSSSTNNGSNQNNTFLNQLNSLPPPPPSSQITSIEVFSFDEAFQSFWQDSLLEGSLPPFVLIGLKETLLNNLKSSNRLSSSATQEDGSIDKEDQLLIDQNFLMTDKINYLLIDEVATPPLPRSKPQVANSIDGASYDGRRSFAPSIRSLSASIRKLTSGWRKSKKDL